MHCPKCGGFLREIAYETVHIHTCDACGGEVIKPAALRLIVRRRDTQFSESLRKSMAERTPRFGAPQIEPGASLTCPCCRMAMKPINYGGDSGISVDRCMACGAMFLEHEELEKIQLVLEQWEDAAPQQVQSIADELERARSETAESTTRAFAGSRFAFVNALMNRLLDAA